MKYKVGQEVRVIDNTSSHGFEILDIVIVIDLPEGVDDLYYCRSTRYPNEEWFLFEDEMYLAERVFTLSELKAIALEIMNLGMELRQHQLQGTDSRSGNEVLKEYLDKYKI